MDVSSIATAYTTFSRVLAGFAWGTESDFRATEYVGAGGAQADYLRVPLADGTPLVATAGQPDPDLIPDAALGKAPAGCGAGHAAGGPGPGVGTRS